AAPRFKFVVTKTGNVALANVALTDTVFGALVVPGALAVGGSAEVARTGTWQAGQHTSVARASGDFADDAGNTQSPSDSDAANYFGAAPAIAVTEYVSVDGGSTWADANSPSGPTLAAGHAAPLFRFVVANSGNVEL